MKTATMRLTPGRHTQEDEAPMPSHLTTSQRFWAKVDKDGPIPEYAPHLGQCWLWVAYTTPPGYGQFWAQGRLVGAHRWAYEQEHGPIPPPLGCDHLCRVPNCVRASHIVAVSSRVNTLRGYGPTAVNARKMHCPEGHPYDKENTYYYGDGRRRCRKCNAKQSMNYKARRAGVALS